MPEHMKKRRTNKTVDIFWQGVRYSIPVSILEKYKISSALRSDSLTVEEAFSDLIGEFGEPALLLRGLRKKEGLSQVEFADAIAVTQQNLSAMENGRRGIGKELAKRIASKFNINYRLLL